MFWVGDGCLGWIVGFLVCGGYFDFEYGGPHFAGYEYSVLGLVVGDAV